MDKIILNHVIYGNSFYKTFKFIFLDVKFNTKTGELDFKLKLKKLNQKILYFCLNVTKNWHEGVEVEFDANEDLDPSFKELNQKYNKDFIAIFNHMIVKSNPWKIYHLC